MSLLALENACVTKERTSLLDDVSFQIKAGRAVGLIGPNGAGKTTAVRALLGLQPLASGRAILAGKDAHGLNPIERARVVSYLPQARSMTWPISVRDMVRLGLINRAQNADALDQALCACDLATLADRSIATLSGGELARVHLARTLISATPVIVVDEPTTALDLRHQFACLELLKARATAGAGVLVILHDLGAATRYCDELILLDGGKLMAQGPPKDILTPTILSRHYGVSGHWHGDQLIISG
jgi:iron complex transport system ATP-binding protein